MPLPDGRIRSRDVGDRTIITRTLGDESVSSVKLSNDIQSDNFVEGTSGWRIRRDTGDLEANDATFRGTVEADDGTLQNLTVVGTITVEGGDIVVSDGDLRSGNFAAGTDGYRLGSNGVLEANDLDLADGTILTDWLAEVIRPTSQGDSVVHGDTNSFTQTETVSVPSWATSVAVIAIGTAQGDATLGTDGAGRFAAHIDIDGDTGENFEAFVEAIEFPPQAGITPHHQRTFTPPATSFDVELQCDAQGTTSLYFRSALSVIAIFSR